MGWDPTERPFEIFYEYNEKKYPKWCTDHVMVAQIFSKKLCVTNSSLSSFLYLITLFMWSGILCLPSRTQFPDPDSFVLLASKTSLRLAHVSEKHEAVRVFLSCAPSWNRTNDLILKRDLLYQLSYGRIIKLRVNFASHCYLPKQLCACEL